MAKPLETVQRPWYDFGFGQQFTVGKGGNHDGRDIQTPQGTPLTAILGGVVTPHTGFYDWGGEVDILTPSGITQTWAHLDALAVKPGQIVQPGQFIGLSGGENLPAKYSTGPHTHFSLFGGNPWDNTKTLDPTPLLDWAQDFMGAGPSSPTPNGDIWQQIIQGGMAGTAALPPSQSGGQTVAQAGSSVINVTVQSALGSLLQTLPGVSGSSDFLWRAGLITLGIMLIIVGVLVTIWPAAKRTGQAATQATFAAAKVAAV